MRASPAQWHRDDRVADSLSSVLILQREIKKVVMRQATITIDEHVVDPSSLCLLTLLSLFLPASLSKMGRKEVYDLVLGRRGPPLKVDTHKSLDCQTTSIFQDDQTVLRTSSNCKSGPLAESLPQITLFFLEAFAMYYDWELILQACVCVRQYYLEERSLKHHSNPGTLSDKRALWELYFCLKHLCWTYSQLVQCNHRPKKPTEAKQKTKNKTTSFS